MSRFPLALVGAGRMGQTHLRALEESDAVTVAAVVEPFPTVELQRSGLAVFTSIGEMLGTVAIQGAVVAAPSDQHVAVVSELANAGVPILCEKPCGVTAAESRAAAAVTTASHTAMQVAYWRRFVPELISLRTHILSGDFGDVHLVACHQWDAAPPPAAFRTHSGGIFVDMGVHEFDQARWITGQDFVDVSSVASPLHSDPDAGDDPDNAYALLPMSGGAVCFVSLGRHHPGGDIVTTEVMAARGTARCEVITVAEGEAVQLRALRAQTESFARWVAGGECEGATIEDAVAALQAAEVARTATTVSRLAL